MRHMRSFLRTRCASLARIGEYDDRSQGKLQPQQNHAEQVTDTLRCSGAVQPMLSVMPQYEKHDSVTTG